MLGFNLVTDMIKVLKNFLCKGEGFWLFAIRLVGTPTVADRAGFAPARRLLRCVRRLQTTCKPNGAHDGQRPNHAHEFAAAFLLQLGCFHSDLVPLEAGVPACNTVGAAR